MGTETETFLDKIGRLLARKLSTQISGYHPYTPSDFHTLCETLLPGDILLMQNETTHQAFSAKTGSDLGLRVVYAAARILSN